MRKFCFFFALTLLGTAAPQAHASLITINATSVRSATVDAAVGFHAADDAGIAFPKNIPLVSGVGASSATTNIAYNNVAGQTIIHYGFEHVRAEGLFSIAATGGTTNSTVFDFNAVTDTKYKLSGLYALTGNNSRFFEVRLYDVTDGQFELVSYQESVGLLNQTLVVGELEGDVHSAFEGSLEGDLTATHRYQLMVSAFTEASNYNGYTPDGGASARGYVTLTIGDEVTGVPEPVSFALLGLASLGGVGLRLRRRAAASRAA